MYATVAVLGLAARLDLVALPAQFAAFESGWVIGVAVLLYVVEFVADKVPWVDSLWDAAHTAVRPLGGALIGGLAAAGASAEVQVVAALLGGSVALTAHLAKAGTRVMVNASPEPFTNWTLSLVEDVVVVGLTWLTMTHPFIAVSLAMCLLFVIVMSASALVGAVRSRMRR